MGRFWWVLVFVFEVLRGSTNPRLGSPGIGSRVRPSPEDIQVPRVSGPGRVPVTFDGGGVTCTVTLAAWSLAATCRGGLLDGVFGFFICGLTVGLFFRGPGSPGHIRPMLGGPGGPGRN